MLVLLAEVEVKVDLRSSSLALTLGRLRWVEVVEVAVAGRREVAVVVVGGRVGGLLNPPVVRAPAVEPAAVRDEAAVPVAVVRRADAELVVARARLAVGEVDAALALDGVSGEIGVVSLEGATSELWATSMFSLSAIVETRSG